MDYLQFKKKLRGKYK